MGEYSAVLLGLCKLEGIRSALIMSDSGDVLERQGELSMPEEKLVHLVLESVEDGRQLAGLVRGGGVEQHYLEYKDFNLTLESFSTTRILVACAAAGTNLGRIRYEFKRSRKIFDEISK